MCELELVTESVGIQGPMDADSQGVGTKKARGTTRLAGSPRIVLWIVLFNTVSNPDFNLGC